MSVQAVGWVLESSTTRLASRLVLLSIANHAKADGTGAWPSYETIATEARVSRRQAIRSVAQLAEAGHIVIEPMAGPKGANLYSIVGMGGDNLSRDNHDTSERKAQGVTSTPAGGDKSSTEGGGFVTRTVIEPRSNQPLAPKNGARKRDELWDAVVAAVGWDPASLTNRERGRTAEAVRDLRSVHATAEEIEGLAVFWPRAHPDARLTPQAISGNISAYRSGQMFRSAGRR